MKRINIFVLLCVFVLTMCAGAWATDVVTVTSKKADGTTESTTYADLRAAIGAITENSSDVTFKLTDNDTTSFSTTSSYEELTIDKNIIITIDGNGKTLKGINNVSTNKDHDLFIKGSGTITIKNLTFSEFGGAIAVNANGYDNTKPIWVGKDFTGTLNLNKITINQYNRTAITATAGKINLDGCTITGRYVKGADTTTFQNGIQVLGATVTIKNTTITNVGSNLAKEDSNIAGCIELSSGGGQTFSGTVTIEGTKFSGQAGVIIAGNENVKNNGTVTITNGEFSGETYDLLRESLSTGTITIKGGKFSKDPSNLSGVTIATGYEVTKSGDWYVVAAKETSTVSNPKVDSSGELSYTIESGKTATLEEVLTAFTSSGGTASQIKELPITSQITKVDNSTLKKLTLEELDLTSASGLTDTTLDLDGVTVDKVTMGKNTKVEKLELDSSSKVEEIDASGATNLEKIDLASNKNIETLNVSNSGVTNLDASGCTNLATLNTKGAKLTVLVLKNCTSLTDLDCSSGGELKELDLSTCTALKTLDVSGNKLLILDLSKLTSLTSSTLGNQTSTESFTLSRNLNLADFLKKALGVTETEALAYAKNITRVVDVATGEDAANYDEDDGTASFESTPKGSIRYYYNTKGTVSNAELADVLAGINDMDVTLTAGVAGEEEKSSGGSSSGCNLVMSEELGVRGVLLFLAAMFMFASMKMKIKRG